SRPRPPSARSAAPDTLPSPRLPRRCRRAPPTSCLDSYTASRKKDALHEPERACGDDHYGTREREASARSLAAMAQTRQNGCDQDDDEQLADFHADVEREQRPSERALR